MGVVDVDVCLCRERMLTVSHLYQYVGIKQDETRHLKELEVENTRLKRLVAELALDKQMLQEVTQKSSAPGRSRLSSIRAPSTC